MGISKYTGNYSPNPSSLSISVAVANRRHQSSSAPVSCADISANGQIDAGRVSVTKGAAYVGGGAAALGLAISLALAPVTGGLSLIATAVAVGGLGLLGAAGGAGGAAVLNSGARSLEEHCRAQLSAEDSFDE